ncbi:uncharacterized protein [Tenebrio molitor]|uniref:uncharacterized protein isoform X4 n=1 Tax=Tenebrio molitor TaxID=7067 RepID=UPI0036249FA0
MEIRFEVVAIENVDAIKGVVYGSSGVMINNKYIITTANILLPSVNDEFKKYLHLGKTENVHLRSCLERLSNLKIICKPKNNGDEYRVENGDVLAVFVSKNIKYSPKEALDGWSVDTVDNCRSVANSLSIFFVIKIDLMGNMSDFKKCLIQWWDLIKNEEVKQCDEICIKSVPFGNKIFLDSYSRGIVSNIFGRNSCLVVSDCPTTPGSEGSPVYKINNSNDGSCRDVPLGMVISASCWWKRIWTGLTLIADIRSILLELLLNNQYEGPITNIPHHHLVGDEVFSVGFPIFSKDSGCKPTVSKGFVIQINESMIKTTCCVNPGMSGGALLNRFGQLVGIIVCNTRCEESVYPRFNMTIPYNVIKEIIQRFLKNNDATTLNHLFTNERKFTSPWKNLEAKL